MSSWLVFGALLLVACAPGANAQLNVPAVNGDIAGFWLGVWHGMITPVTFVVSLFNASVQVYEVHNNGGWYNLGFLIGVGGFFGGGGHGSARVIRGSRG